MTSPIRVVFFDAAGTLVHVPRGVGAHYREVAARHGFAPEEAVLGRAFKTAFHTLPPPPTTRGPRADDDKGWWQTLVKRVLGEAGAPADFDHEACFEELYQEFTLPGVWALYSEVGEVLRHLAPRYRLGIISNFDGRLRAVLRQLEVLEFFETVTISSEVGAEKPDPWIFQRALETAGIAPENALHVGDDPECDWEGARAAGLREFRLDRPQNSLRDLLAELGS